MSLDNESHINDSDARVFRELLLLVCADIHEVLSSIKHAKRSCLRGVELEKRAGIFIEQTPIIDLLDVISSAATQALAHVDLGLDAGIMVLRELGSSDGAPGDVIPLA